MARNRRASRSQRRASQKEARKPKQVKEAVAQATPKVISKPLGSLSNYYKAKPSCSHWQQPFHLNDGLTILVSAWSDEPRLGDGVRNEPVDIGVYLDSYWQDEQIMVSGYTDLPLPQRGHQGVKIMYPWRDGSAPDESLRVFIETCKWMLHQIRTGKRVDTGCFAAHGRTGTMLSSLLIIQGLSVSEAVGKVRSTHCSSAVETYEQVDFLYRLDEMINARPHPGNDPPIFGSKEINPAYKPTTNSALSWGTSRGRSPATTPAITPYTTSFGNGKGFDGAAPANAIHSLADDAELEGNERDKYLDFLRRLEESDNVADFVAEAKYSGGYMTIDDPDTVMFDEYEPDIECIDGSGACPCRRDCALSQDCMRERLFDDLIQSREDRE